MNKIPLTLYRKLEKDEYVREMREGYLRFTAIRKFQNCDGNRQDKLEGTGSGKIKEGYHFVDCGDNQPWNECYILCFSENKNIKNWGEHLVTLTNPEELKNRIEKCFPDKGVMVWLEKVRYTKNQVLEVEPDGIEWIKRKYFEKPPQFRPEKEWRFLIYFSIPYRFSSDNLTIYTDPLYDILR